MRPALTAEQARKIEEEQLAEAIRRSLQTHDNAASGSQRAPGAFRSQPLGLGARPGPPPPLNALNNARPSAPLRPSAGPASPSTSRPTPSAASTSAAMPGGARSSIRGPGLGPSAAGPAPSSGSSSLTATQTLQSWKSAPPIPPPSPTGTSSCCFCKKAILPGATFQSAESQGYPAFHPECFTCGVCELQVKGNFVNKDGRPHHPDCFTKKYAPRCKECNRTVEGQYLSVGDQSYHPACFRCAKCRTPIQGAYHQDSTGRPQCADCFAAANSTTCAACRKPLRSTYATVDGRSYHQECLKCAACKGPLQAAMSIHDGRFYHPECGRLLFTPRCYVCKELLAVEASGVCRFLTEPEWPELKACLKHQHDGTPLCTGCNRFVDKGHLHRFDGVSGRHALCEDCVGVCVPDTDGAQPIYKELAEFYKSQGLIFPHGFLPPLMLVDYNALNEAAKYGGSLEKQVHVEGLCLTEVEYLYRAFGFGIDSRPQGRVGNCNVTAILALCGLPRPRLGAVIAHEMMHAYLTLTGFKKRAPGSLGASQEGWGLSMDVEEGLCELMAWLWLDSRGRLNPTTDANKHNNRLVGSQGRKMIERPDPVYGEGLRQAQRCYQALGLTELLGFVRIHGQFPIV